MKWRKIAVIFMLAGVLGITGCKSDSKEEAVKDESVVLEEEPKEEQKAEQEEDSKEETLEMSEEDKMFLLGTWGNETAFDDDPTMQFSMAYYTEFKEDGTVEQNGYRNMDSGTYQYLDENTVEAVFDHNVFHDAANPDDRSPIEGYVYTVTYTIDRDAGTLMAVYSQEFHDAVTSNAEDGILRKTE